jgi:hypothetical protein
MKIKSEKLCRDVEQWHKDNFEMLGSKKFHFASRLFLWKNDDFCKRRLDELKDSYIGATEKEHATKLHSFLEKNEDTVPSTKIQKIRQPYHEKYPTLKSFDKILFRNLFCNTVYGINLKEAVLSLGIEREMAGLRGALLEDREAIKMLSTMAVNFFYTSHLLFGDRMAEPELFLNLIVEDWKDGKEYLQLRLYLATHAIIGEASFYANPINYKKEIYIEMAKFAEKLIADNFKDISLDIKFEFLVCAKMLGFISVLEKAIREEAMKSVSADGLFFVDKHNSNAGIADSFEKSEHRNVLAIMGSQEWGCL